MSYISNGVEYALHCLLYLIDAPGKSLEASARDLADLQGVSAEYLAKIFTKLHRAGIVVGVEGSGGGFALARAAEKISFLDVIEAVDGKKPLFECKNIRLGCAVFGGKAPRWASQGVCEVHAVMLEAEARMRAVLASHTLAEVGAQFGAKAPHTFAVDISKWLAERSAHRNGTDAEVPGHQRVRKSRVSRE